MADEIDPGVTALHIAMAIVSDMAIHDEPRLERVQRFLADMLGTKRSNDTMRAEIQSAYDAIGSLRRRAKDARPE